MCVKGKVTSSSRHEGWEVTIIDHLLCGRCGTEGHIFNCWLIWFPSHHIKMLLLLLGPGNIDSNQGLGFSCYAQVSLSGKNTKRKVTGSKGWAKWDWGSVGRTQRSMCHERSPVGQVYTALGTSETEFFFKKFFFFKVGEHRKESGESGHSAAFLFPNSGCNVTSHIPSQHCAFLPWWVGSLSNKSQSKPLSPQVVSSQLFGWQQQGVCN